MHSVPTEAELLYTGRKLFIETDPDIVVAYNGVNFDNKFPSVRAGGEAGGDEHWDQESANGGDPVAMFNLANIFSSRADHLQQAADDGSSVENKGPRAHSDAAAHASMQQAFSWYNKSASNGFVPAMFSVANCYLRGGGTAARARTGVGE